MDPVLIIFGSVSDAPVYDRIVARLHAESIPCVMKVCSAHRSPDYLDEILRTESFSVVIAGAGLAAHLPGVIASKTFRPVIGVPVRSNLDGADSLLSIMQMPPNIPVLSVGVDAAEEAARIVAQMAQPLDEIAIMTNGLLMDKFEKAKAWLDRGNIPYVFTDEILPGKVNVVASELAPSLIVGDETLDDALVITIPVKATSTLKDIPDLLALTRKGLFVGINRVENALMGAAQILGKDGKFDTYQQAFRDGMQEAIKKSNL